MALKGFTPTTRTAALLAIVALSALLLPIALVIVLAVVLLGAAAADGWSVRTSPAVTRRIERLQSRGVSSALHATAQAPAVAACCCVNPPTPELAVDDGTGERELSARLLPRRRGRHELPAVASASIGALGLARVHHPVGDPEELRVYPDLVSARTLIARMRRNLAAHPGRLARGPLGLGTEFESVREYSPDDDFRQLNWRATARVGRPMSNQYRIERDRDVICMLDAGRLMAAPIGERTMLDAALDALTLIAFAADELGDRCGAIAFDQEIRRVISPRHMSGRPVIEALFDLQARPVDSDFEAAFIRVGRSRRALVAVFTDLVDEAAARSLLQALPMLARRHAVIVASATDPALVSAIERAPTTERELAAAVVAGDVLATRAAAAKRLARAGAQVIEAPASELSARCLDAYLTTKLRARL